MEGEINLNKILGSLNPVLNQGSYVYCTVDNANNIPLAEILFFFQEAEGFTVVLKKEAAEKLNLSFSYVSSWITLQVHSSLSAVGMTAAFSAALGKQNISCNVVAAYYHDHIFVDEKDTVRAMQALKALQKQ